MNAKAPELVPPNDVASEMCLLASVILSSGNRAQFAQIRGVVSRQMFYLEDHRVIWDAMCELIDAQRAVDGVILANTLRTHGMFDEIGGMEYLAEIVSSVPNAAHAMHYAGIIRERWQCRELIRHANDIIRRAWNLERGETADALAMEVSSTAAKLAATGHANQVYRLDEVAAEVYSERMNPTGKRRIPTGIVSLDQIIGGLRVGGKLLIGAKAGMGKSLLLKQIGLNLVRDGIRFGVISVEESRHKIAENCLSNIGGVINNRIAFGELSTEDWKSFAGAVAGLTNLPFWIVDSARSLSSIIAAAHILHAEHRCEVIAVDHLHIIDGESGHNENREREIAKISAELKWVWKDLGVAGIEAAQLNRTSGKEPPTLSSLRDSGSLEQDADVVILLHREDYYRKNKAEHDGVIELIIAKNKDGASGTIPISYDGARQTIRDPEPKEPDWREAIA